MSQSAKLLHLFIFLTFSIFYSNSQKVIIGAPSIGMGSISRLSTTKNYFQNNPAILGFSNELYATNISIQQSYISTEVQTKTIGLSIPNNHGAWGFSVSKDGFSDFNTTSISLAYGISLSKQTAIGIQANTQYLNTNRGRSTLIVLPEVSIIGYLTDQFGYSTILYNPTRASYEQKSLYRSDSEIKLGLFYTNHTTLTLAFEIRKTSQNPSIFAFGGQYKMNPHFNLNWGFQTNKTLSSGIDYTYQRIQYSISIPLHLELGLSPTISILYDFYKKG